MKSYLHHRLKPIFRMSSRVLFAVDEGDGNFCDGTDGVSLVAEEGAVSVWLGAGGSRTGICDVFWVDLWLDRIAVQRVYSTAGVSEPAFDLEFGEPAVVSSTCRACNRST